MATYINIYSIGREYGGPEEGGWWYDVGEPVQSIRVRGPFPSREVRAARPADTGRILRKLNEVRLAHGFTPSYHVRFQKRSVQGHVRPSSIKVRRGEYANTLYSERPDHSLISVEDHPAVAFPASRPHYE